MVTMWLSRIGYWLTHCLFEPKAGEAVPLEQWVLDRLPEDYRLAVWLHFCEGMTYSELADALAVSEAGARGRLREGVRLFQDYLARLAIATPAPVAVMALGGGGSSLAPRRLLKNLKEIVRMV